MRWKRRSRSREGMEKGRSREREKGGGKMGLGKRKIRGARTGGGLKVG
jgi:hypothetical protein